MGDHATGLCGILCDVDGMHLRPCSLAQRFFIVCEDRLTCLMPAYHYESSMLLFPMMSTAGTICAHEPKCLRILGEAVLLSCVW